MTNSGRSLEGDRREKNDKKKIHSLRWNIYVEEKDNVNLDDERERHWRMVSEDNDGGVDNAKALLHAKSWDIYINEKEKLVKGGSPVEVVSNDKNKFLWGVVDDHVVEEPTDHEEIGLRGFDFNVFKQYE